MLSVNLSGNFFSKLGLILLCALIGSASIARAQYIPPDAEVPDGSTVANGSRSACELEDGEAIFTSLAPMAHLGKGDRQSALFFYVPVVSDYRLDVGIFDGEGQFLELLGATGSGAGIVSVEMSPELDEGLYQIQAAIACGEGDEYDAAIVTYYHREPLPETIQTELQAITEPSAQSDIYAKAGYWFDAFALADETQKIELLQQLAAVESEPQQSHLEATITSLEMKNMILARQTLAPQ